MMKLIEQNILAIEINQVTNEVHRVLYGQGMFVLTAIVKEYENGSVCRVEPLYTEADSVMEALGYSDPIAFLTAIVDGSDAEVRECFDECLAVHDCEMPETA